MFKSTLLSIALLFLIHRHLIRATIVAAKAHERPACGAACRSTYARTVPDEPPVVTKHEIRLDERTIKYTVTTGMMPIKNQVSGETEAGCSSYLHAGRRERPVEAAFDVLVQRRAEGRLRSGCTWERWGLSG